MHSLSAGFVRSNPPPLYRSRSAISRRAPRPWRQPCHRNRLRILLRSSGDASSRNDTGTQTGSQSAARDVDSRGSSTNNHRTPLISRTLFGRVLVEALSLSIGAILLLFILLWRFSQFVAFRVVHLITWLSGLRQLGKLAFSRLTRVRSIAIPVPSFSHAVRRLFSGQRRIGKDSKPVPVVDVQHQQVPSVKDTPAATDSDTPTYSRGRSYSAPPKSKASTHGRRLILLRHAKTHWDRDGDTPDHERSLSAKGCDEARLIGNELVRIDWLPDLILCSDAARTVQTLQLLQVPQSLQAKTTWTDSLYYAVTADEMVAAIDEALSSFPPKSTLLVVAHNPGCEELVEFLAGERAEMGTGCAALLECKEGTKNGRKSRSQSHLAEETFSITSDNVQWSLVELIRPSSVYTNRPWRKD